jgi:AcrR family transcriptional regulator
MAVQPLTPERRRQQTREYLLQAAAQVFAERGFHAASLDEVASVAGFTKGAVYSNFKSKEDLFLALLESMYEQETAALHATLEGSDVPPTARLSDFVALIRDEVSALPNNWTSLYYEFCLYAMRNPAARSKLAELDAAEARAIADILRTEWRRLGITGAESPDLAAKVIMALFHGLSLMRALDPEEGDQLVETAISLVARGLGAI